MLFHHTKKSNLGQGLVQYALIISIVALIVVVSVSIFGENSSNRYEGIITAIDENTGNILEEEPSIFTETACENEVNNIKNWKLTAKGKKDWTCDGDSLCVENNKSDQNFAYSNCSKTKSRVPADYELEITNAKLTGGDGLNLMFRMQKYNVKPDGYSFTYDAGTNAFVILKWVKGKTTPIASTTAAGFTQMNTPHHFKIQVQGSTIKAYVDGNLVLTTQDATYPSGGAGVHVAGKEGAACFDDLTIRIAEQ